MRFENKELQRRLGITAVYVTHDQAEALALSDRVAVMNEGRIEQVGTPDEIYDCPRSKFVADFIGLSNFIEGTIIAISGERAIISANGLEIAVPALHEMQRNQKLLIFIRPNDIDPLLPTAEGGENTFRGVVDKLIYLGDRIDYRIAVGERLELRGQTDGKVRFERGDNVRVRLPVERCKAILE